MTAPLPSTPSRETATLPSTEAGLRQHYGDVQARLYGRPQSRAPRIPEAIAAPESEQEAAAEPAPAKANYGGTPTRAMERTWNIRRQNKIIAEVCAAHRVFDAQIKGPSRLSEIIAARFEAYYRLHTELGYSTPMIGIAMGGKHHAGIIHGIRKHADGLKRAADARLRQEASP